MDNFENKQEQTQNAEVTLPKMETNTSGFTPKPIPLPNAKTIEKDAARQNESNFDSVITSNSFNNNISTINNSTKRKTNNRLKKLLITIIIIALTAIIALIAVIAYTTQDFTVENRLSFEARHIDANIIVSVTNGRLPVTLENPEFDIASTDPEGKKYGVFIPQQSFEGTGESCAIVYTITIKNTTTNNANFSVNLNDIPYKSNINSNYTFMREESPVNNGCSLTKGQTLVITISLILKQNIETQESYEFQLNLAIV